jgi:hypothetical protein
MAYDTSGLSLADCILGGAFRVWVYRSTDPFSTVDDSGYFTDATARGMLEGDFMYVQDTDSDPPDLTLAYVSVINATTGVGTVASMAVGTTPSLTTLTVSGATALNGNTDIGNAAADTIGFYGATKVSQRASSVMATTNIASSTDFGATQLAWAQEITNTINGLGLHKGTA